MQFANWTEALHGRDLAIGPSKLESNRAGNHTAVYFPVRRHNKPIRFYTPLLKCKFPPNEEYNSIDCSQYAPSSGSQEQVDSFIACIRELEGAVVDWAIQNADHAFSDFDPIPEELIIRHHTRSCLVDRIESVKFRLMPEQGVSYFDAQGRALSRDEVLKIFNSPNLPNVRVAGEIKSVGIYNGVKRKDKKVAFDGKLELRLFALQVRVLPPDDADGTAIPTGVCLLPPEDDF